MLTLLDCGNNEITKLDLPESLEILNCEINSICELNLPSNLKSLLCRFNKITELSYIPETLTHLKFEANPFIYDFGDIDMSDGASVIEYINKYNEENNFTYFLK